MIALGTLTASDAQARKSRKRPVLDAISDKINAALVAPPKDGEVCFSPDEPCDIKLLKFIDSARSSIDVAVYDLNLPGLVELLLKKSSQMPVRILVDKRQAKGEHSRVPEMIEKGANIRFGRQRGVMHNKFVIVDGKAVEAGSFNFTRNASRANEENQIYLARPEVVERYKQRFEKIWRKAKPPKPGELIPKPKR